jgi:hypothetical protein
VTQLRAQRRRSGQQRRCAKRARRQQQRRGGGGGGIALRHQALLRARQQGTRSPLSAAEPSGAAAGALRLPTHAEAAPLTRRRRRRRSQNDDS